MTSLKEVLEKYGYGTTRDWPYLGAGCGDGWLSLIDNLLADLFKMGWDGDLLQIKEKFGGLRFYIGSATEEIHDRTALTERLSYFVCEVCGQSGLPRASGWIKTLCRKHAEERGATEVLSISLYIYEDDKIAATIQVKKGEHPPDEDEEFSSFDSGKKTAEGGTST